MNFGEFKKRVNGIDPKWDYLKVKFHERGGYVR